MQSVCRIELPESYLPRFKTQYPNLDGGKMIPPILTTLFQLDVKRQVQLAAHNRQLPLPIEGDISLYITLYTSRRVNLLGVCKNIMDALNRVLYNDDSAVKSIIIERVDIEGTVDRINMNILSGFNLRTLEVPAQLMNSRSILEVQFETVVEGNYLGYPPNKDVVLPESYVDLNHETDQRIREVVCTSYRGELITNPVVSIVLNTDRRKEDIDNMAKNYLVGMKGVIYNSEEDIFKLHIRRVAAAATNNDTITIYSRS